MTLDESLVGLPEAFVEALVHLAGDLAQPLVDARIQRLGGVAQAREHRFAVLVHAFAQRELQRVERVARLA